MALSIVKVLFGPQRLLFLPACKFLLTLPKSAGPRHSAKAFCDGEPGFGPKTGLFTAQKDNTSTKFLTSPKYWPKLA
jgi:hypothetical protein